MIATPILFFLGGALAWLIGYAVRWWGFYGMDYKIEGLGSCIEFIGTIVTVPSAIVSVVLMIARLK